MTGFTVRDIMSIPGAVAKNFEGIADAPVRCVRTDSRLVKKGDVFVAFQGAVHDGHDFVRELSAKGSLLSVVNASWFRSHPAECAMLPLLVVKDTMRAYGEIAREYRRRFAIPLIAITGSNGKTGTKELVASILATKYTVLSTKGNLNNHLGLPATLLNLNASHEVIVVEMGTNRPGDIPYLCAIAQPSCGLITNIGSAHLEKLKSREGIAEEKGTLYECLPSDGIAFVFEDEPLVKPFIRRGMRKVSFGSSKKAGVRISGIVIDAAGRPTVTLEAPAFLSEPMTLRLKTMGRHSAYNAAAAAAVGFAFGCSAENIRLRIEAYKGFGKRMQILRSSGLTILDDTYNANPDSTIAALETFAAMQVKGMKIVVLGDMLELGGLARSEHTRVGEHLAALGFPYICTFGTPAKAITRAVERKAEFAQHFTDKAALCGALSALVVPGDAVLVKGSRGMKMEEIVRFLQTLSANWKEKQ